jgi:predicted Zn-dependent protease
LFDETGGLGKVAFPRHDAGHPEAKARDISTFHALEWLLSRRNGTSAMWAHLGALHARRGEGEAAATALQTSLDLGPADGWTRLSLGNGLSALGRRREAVAVLQRLGDSADLEFDVARKGAALLARLGAPAAAAALGVRAAQLVGLSGAITLARRYARQRAAAG